MASTADTLTATGAPVTLAGPPPEYAGSATNYPYTPTDFAVMGSNPDEILVASDNTTGNHQYISGYDLGGNLLFRDDLQVYNTFGPSNNLELATIPGGGVAAAWYQFSSGYHGVPQTSDVHYTVVSADGSLGGLKFAPGSNGSASLLQTLSTRDGFILEWQDVGKSGNTAGNYTQLDRFNANGSVVSNNYLGDAGPFAWVDIGLAGGELGIQDNRVFMTGNPGITVPGEPAHAITGLDAAALTDGHSAAVAWTDSGTDYVSLYNATTNSFGPTIGLDWGGAKDLHTVALADGGFAVSWSNGGAYKGELFTADGTGGGVISLTGEFAALDSHGELYTVGLDGNGAYVVQTYAVNGPGSTGGDSTGGGSTAGQTYTSDNAGDHWTGTTGNDVFNLGRGGDVVAGAGGDDTFKFAETPWAGGHITDFNIGDTIDLTGLLAASGYTGSDPVGAGYLKLTTDAQGNGQIWADYNQSGNSGWWLVTTVDGVGAYDMQLQNGLVTHTPGPGSDGTVSTADPNYQAPDGVTKIILTGSAQTVTGNNAGDAFVSNDTGNHLTGGTGNDTFDLGRDGDIVTGGAGSDTFVYQEVPWAGGRISDFSASQGDRIDLNALLAHAGYTSGDPIAEGYLKILDTTNGAQVWADADGPGSSSGWWLVDTLTGVSAGVIGLSGGVVGGGGNGAVVVEAASYVASRTEVTAITVAGSSPQHIVGNDLSDTFHDNNNANVFSGLGGGDTYILGLGGSTVNGGSGADTVVIAGVPTSHENIAYFASGSDRIDLRPLLASIGSTGSDPFADGHLKFSATTDASGQYAELQAYDSAHGQWADVVQIYNTTPSQFHYADGWLT